MRTTGDRTPSGVEYNNDLASINGRLCEKVFKVLKDLWTDVTHAKKYKLPSTKELEMKEQKIKFILELLHED